MSKFIYVLKLLKHLEKEENWTKQEEEIVGRHFKYLQNLLKEGVLVLAGKTDGLDEDTFGIVIFEASSYNDALNIMENDPAIKQGIMNAKLYPYTIALMRK